MNEIDLIVKYLEKKGSKVADIAYHSGFEILSVHGSSVNVGRDEGLELDQCFFFGHIDFRCHIAVLVDPNVVTVGFESRLKGRVDINNVITFAGPDMIVLSDGALIQCKRIYGKGFNYIEAAVDGPADGNFQVSLNYNGYLFVMK
ncbi:MAG TPA: hypothetical protein VMV77_02235 [Bacteroidales bacterium]|nr:hypothetical protein [Bacteroidales bacterium]